MVLFVRTPKRMNGYGPHERRRPEGLHPTHQTKQCEDLLVGANVPFCLGHASYRVVGDWGPSPFDRGPMDHAFGFVTGHDGEGEEARAPSFLGGL